MPAFRHLVVGLDLHPKTGQLTPGTVAAIAHARWLAEGRSIRCTLLHSTAADEFWDPTESMYGPRAVPDPSREALEGAARELRDAGVETELVISKERAWQAVVRCVVEAPADLVLVGKRSEVDPDGPLLGSQATKLLRTCPCAVWVVKPGATTPPRRLLAATDLEPVGERVIERASQLATFADAELHVVHSFQFTMAAQLEANEEGFIERMGDETTQRIREVLTQVGHDPEAAHLHVGLTTPTRAVLECVERYEPDLVVMATISRGGVAGLLLGNTAERLLQRLDTCLLTVKPADFVCPVSFDG